MEAPQSVRRRISRARNGGEPDAEANVDLRKKNQELQTEASRLRAENEQLKSDVRRLESGTETLPTPGVALTVHASINADRMGHDFRPRPKTERDDRPVISMCPPELLGLLCAGAQLRR